MQSPGPHVVRTKVAAKKTLGVQASLAPHVFAAFSGSACSLQIHLLLLQGPPTPPPPLPQPPPQPPGSRGNRAAPIMMHLSPPPFTPTSVSDDPSSSLATESQQSSALRSLDAEPRRWGDKMVTFMNLRA
eukprot:1147430-Pelagomonas_calceolata.AAC.6